jgi:hypothetical protein
MIKGARPEGGSGARLNQHKEQALAADKLYYTYAGKAVESCAVAVRQYV